MVLLFEAIDDIRIFFRLCMYLYYLLLFASVESEFEFLWAGHQNVLHILFSKFKQSSKLDMVYQSRPYRVFDHTMSITVR